MSFQSPGTAFLTLTCDESYPGIGSVADAALATLKEEYHQLDDSPYSGTIAGEPAIGHDVEFFSLDLTNTCLIRAFSATQGTILLFAQASDLDPVQIRVLQAMIASIQLDDE